MSLADLYADYLRTRKPDGFADALASIGLVAEAELLSRWDGVELESVVAGGPWSGRRVTVSTFPPQPREAGEVWFDPLETTLMLLIPSEPLDPNERYAPEAIAAHDPFHSWLAIRTVARWQIAAFLRLAEIRPRELQVKPAIELLDPERLVGGDELAPASGLTYGEAALFAGWLGKMVADVYDWSAAARSLSQPEIDELWGRCGREWGGKIDEGVALAIGRVDVDADLDELVLAPPAGSEYGEESAPNDVCFRTRVLTRFGVSRTPAVDPTWFEPVQLGSVLARDG